MPITHRSSAKDARNPLVLEYPKLLLEQGVDTSWVIKMCKQYGTECSQPDCDRPGTELFVTLYSCSFVCLVHMDRTVGEEPIRKAYRVILSDEIDIDLYTDFVDRTLDKVAGIANGSVAELTGAQVKALRKLQAEERDAEHRARMALRKRKNEGTNGDPFKANIVHLTDVGGQKWAAIEFDPRQGWDGVILPSTLTSKKKFAPEVHESNDTGLPVEDLF